MPPKKKKLIILSVTLFAIAGYLFADYLRKEFGTVGFSLKVEELGQPDDARRDIYLMAEKRLEKKIMKRKKKGRPADPKDLRDMEKLRTVYLKMPASKDPEVLAALGKKRKAIPAKPAAAAPAAKDKATPKPADQKKEAHVLPTKSGNETTVVLPKSVNVETPIPAAASMPTKTIPPAVVADDVVYSRLSYISQDDAAWDHSWQFTAPPAFLKNNSISVVVYLWHNDKLVSESVLFQHPAVKQGTKEGMKLYFRAKEGLRQMSPEGNDLMYRISSNKIASASGNTFIRLRNMPNMKFMVNRKDFRFASEDSDLFIAKTMFQVVSPPPTMTRIIVKLVVNSDNSNLDSVAH